MSRNLSLNVLPPASPEWTAGRIETLLSHFHSPTARRPNVEDAAMMDWISALRGFTQSQISGACDAWLRSQKWRPTPRDILGLIEGQRKTHGGGKVASLSPKEATTVQAILDCARRHIEEYPEGSPLHDHAVKTLKHWGQE